MKRCLVPLRTGVAIFAGLWAGCLVGDSISAEPTTESAAPAASSPLTDLSFGNLFSAGWDEPFSKRPHPTGAPDLTLLRVQSNLLLRSIRTDYSFEEATSSSSHEHSQFASQLVEYSFNRRLMLAAFANYQWIREKDGDTRRGAAYGGLARLQLVDLPNTSYAFNLRVAAPRDGTGETQTPMGFALAGWHDLTPLSLPRVGLYWHVQEETYLGPHAPGARQNQLTYDLSLAKTWTSPENFFGNFTTFFENYARTELDGHRHGETTLTLTPGVRFNFRHHHVFMAGVDFPVTDPKPFNQIYRFTYIFAF